MVVDDEQPIRIMLQTILSSYGFEVVPLHRRDHLREEIIEHAPDAILMDIMMDTGLLEALSTIPVGEAPPILLISAYPSPTKAEEIVAQTTPLGVVGYLPKPFVQIDDLVLEVQRVTGQPPLQSTVPV